MPRSSSKPPTSKATGKVPSRASDTKDAASALADPTEVDPVAHAERTVARLLDDAIDLSALAALKLEVAGKRGPLQPLQAELKSLDPAARKTRGASLQQARTRLSERFAQAQQRRQEADDERVRQAGRADLSLPGRRTAPGAAHPLRLIEQRVLEVLCGLGFEIAEGPLVEHDWYNFAALNMPEGHPAREMQDTFFVASDVVLRTHTSNVQVRTMTRRPPPLAIVAPGMVFRNDQVDATHTPVFHQVEGLWVDAHASFAELKGTLQVLLEALFGSSSRMRFRPSFFPFTEPSTEVDVSCSACVGRTALVSPDCKLCRGTGWIEVLGAGMVDPAVLSHVGYDPEHVQGFAFGIGMERLALLLYGIDDIRALYENETSFLAAFAQRPLPAPPYGASESCRAR